MATDTRYFRKGTKILGPVHEWRNKHGSSIQAYNAAAEREGLLFYTRHWWNLHELHRAVRHLIKMRF